MKVIFMGTPPFAEKILSYLIDNKYDIAAVFTQPDKKTGRKQEISKSAVKLMSEKLNLKIFEPAKFNDEVVQNIKNIDPEMIIVAAYGKIIPKEVLEIPKFGAINVHASILPKYRGASPIQNSLLNGEKETGATIMLMDKGIDTGDILNQKKMKISDDETTRSLSEKLALFSGELLIETIPLYINQIIQPQKQDDSQASFCKMLKREDGKIDWNDSTQKIYNKYRAFYPWPGIFTSWQKNGDIKRLKLNKISLSNNAGNEDSEVGKVNKFGDDVIVATSNGNIILQEVQLEGKAAAKIKDFINGHSDFIGSILK